MNMISNKQYADAEPLFEALCLEEIGEHEDRTYRYYLSICQIELGKSDPRKYDQAADNLGTVLKGLTPGTPEYSSFSVAHVDRGLALLMAGRTDEAISSLEEFARHAPETGRNAALLLRGIAEYRDQRYSDAVRTLQLSVKDVDKDSTQYAAAFYYIGLAQARDPGVEVDVAKESLKLALQQTPTDIGQRARTTLDQLDRTGTISSQPFNFTLTFEAGLYYDTNVVLLGRGTASTDRISNEQDNRLGLYTDFDFDWRPQRPDLRGWHFNLGASIFESWHASIQEFNFQNYAADLSVGRTVFESEGFVSAIELSMRYDYDYSLLGNDGYLSRNSLALIADIIENGGRTRTLLQYQWQFRDYEEELFSGRFDRDGDYNSFEIFQEFDLRSLAMLKDDVESRRAGLTALAIGYRFANNSTSGREFDYEANTVFARLAAQLPHKLSARFDAELEWQDYGHRSVVDFHRAYRSDFIQRYTFRLSLPMKERGQTLSAVVAWTYDDSNVKDRLGQEVYSYDRVIFGLTYTCELLNPHQQRRAKKAEKAP